MFGGNRILLQVERAEFAHERHSVGRFREIHFVRHKEGPRVRHAEILFIQMRFAGQPRFGTLEAVPHRLQLADPIVRTKIDEQQRQVRSADQSQQIRVEHVDRDGRGIDQLHHDVFPWHHARERLASGERIGRYFGRRPGEAAEQLAFAGVGSADQHGAAGALSGNPNPGRRLFRRPLLFGLLPRFADLLLEFRLEFVGALVLGHLPQHHLEAAQLLVGRRRAAIVGFGLVVLRREIGWHGPAQGYSAPASSKYV